MKLHFPASIDEHRKAVIPIVLVVIDGNGRMEDIEKNGSWNCTACTFLNKKPMALACLVCGTERR